MGVKKIAGSLGITLLGAGYIGAAVAAQPVKSEGLAVCAKGDKRIAIPVWEPKVDAAGNLSSEPPQQDGQIVYIAIDHAAKDAVCNNTEMLSFTRPESMEDPMLGGLAVNISGNAQAKDGICRLRGYYRNQDVEGMHQGWVETHFGAVEKGAVSPGKHRLTKPVER